MAIYAVIYRTSFHYLNLAPSFESIILGPRFVWERKPNNLPKRLYMTDNVRGSKTVMLLRLRYSVMNWVHVTNFDWMWNTQCVMYLQLTWKDFDCLKVMFQKYMSIAWNYECHDLKFQNKRFSFVLCSYMSPAAFTYLDNVIYQLLLSNWNVPKPLMCLHVGLQQICIIFC